ncbi:hypothetical protein K0M31_004673 [Melipona bicolor]|uniref:Uncharacterized protein n=1 Tax=Melipona bicolor TaxID=60889 RepID=A0AA40FX91_9HYME|nr:hypothetical protein K0M31_004673 [Melipona bicolor]
MQSSAIEYNSQNSDLSGEYGNQHNANEHQPEQAMDDVSNMKQCSEDSDSGQNLLQCPVCTFTSLNR